MIKADECFLCAIKLRGPGIINYFRFWRSKFHFATALYLSDQGPRFILVPLCQKDFEDMKANKIVIAAMIESKLQAIGEL